MSEREGSSDREMVLKRQHSFSDSGRSSVPMWDSSDPDRAPPPLPLNPGTSSPTTRPNTSASIAAAARQLTERARESAPLSSYTTNNTPQQSPEKSLVKGAYHKRMQSLQPGNVRDLRSYLDGQRSPERSLERPSSRGAIPPYTRENSKDSVYSSPEKSPERSTTPTPASRDLKETPALRPSTRQPPRAILGENTPPSATMLALQNMQVPDTPFNDITNSTPTRTSTAHDGLVSTQILHLTTIATNLQREMAQLSRRSKDNATDLVSLKAATNSRDEDIRKSLRELVTSVNSTNGVQGLLGPPGSMSRSTSSYGPQFLDSKPFNSPPSASKFVPRASSAASFLDDSHIGSPSPYSVEGAASVAMLEKIIREMVTKEGQERLLSTLSEVLEKSSKDNVEAARKVEELAEFIKEKSESQALVPRGLNVKRDGDGAPKLELNFDSPGTISTNIEPKEFKLSNDSEIIKLLQRIKDSVTTSGGMTAEVKGLIRDLRGEVLGMGRELGRKLDEAASSHEQSKDRAVEDGQSGNAEIERVIQEGLAELKDHMQKMMEGSENAAFSFKELARTRPDGDEMFAVVKHALAEHGSQLSQSQPADSAIGLDRDEILTAVKDACKDFEPNIELQQFGLEREEIMAVLKEGLQDYQDTKPEEQGSGANQEEIFEAMQRALADFQPPWSAQHMAEMKGELLESVREALQHHVPSDSPPADDTATREAVIEAVKEALANHGPAAPREIEISREDLFDAMKASLDGSAIPFHGFGEQVLQQLHDLVDGMKLEFKQYSAANGRDTEQVLDAVKDGLESLRAEIETYVDRAQDVTGKDEIVDTVRGGLEQLRADVQGYVSQGPTGDHAMLQYIKAEFEHLHETLGTRERGLDGEEPTSGHKTEILTALQEGLDGLKRHVGSRGLDEDPTDEMLDAMKEEFEQLRDALLSANSADKSEIIEHIQDSVGALHAKIGTSDFSTGGQLGPSDELLSAMREEFAQLRETHGTSLVRSEGPADTEAILEGLREAIDGLRVQLSGDHQEASAEALGAIREELEQFKESLGTTIVRSGPAGDNGESLNALKAGLEEIRETTAKSANMGITNDMLEAIRGEFESLRTSIGSTMVHGASNEEVLDTIRLGLDDLRSHLEKKLDNPEHAVSLNSEILDALNDHLETLKADVVKTLDKPLDMTVNYEILDTLKDGIASLRADMDKLRGEHTGVGSSPPYGGEIVLADGAETSTSRDIGAEAAIPVAETLKRNDLDKMEVLLAQLQIKVEAMNATVEDLPTVAPATAQPAEGTALKTDMIAMEDMLKDIQAALVVIAAKEQAEVENAVRKDDTDAIETLLRNTKAQIDEMVLPDPATAVTKEHLDAVEAVVRITGEAVDGLAEKFEVNGATKADVAVVEVLAQDLKTALEDFKEKVSAAPSEEDDSKMTKADLDVLGIICTDIKTKVNEMVLPDPESLPSKAEIEQLTGLINDFRESHDKMKDSYETDIAVTAKAFDDRKKEFEDTVQQIGDVKEFLTEIKAELISKIAEGESGVDTLGETLKGIEENIGSNEGVAADVKELMETIAREFERAHGSLEGMKVDQEQGAATMLEKHAEHKDAVVSELSDKLDTLFDGLMTKYDDAQHAAEAKATATEEKAAQQEELLNGTKAMADDLRISIDTLGVTLTTFNTTFTETTDKMAEDSKTVFNRVDDTFNKLDETQEGLKGEHQATREEVTKVMTGVTGLQGDFTEFHPRFMVTLQEVLALVGQHYEHSKNTPSVSPEHTQAVRDLQDQIRGFQEESNAHVEGLKGQTEELKTHVSSGLSSLPALMPPAPPGSETAEKYDDSDVHEKLDKLMSQATETSDPTAQLERLDQIHQQVMATAAEVSAFVAVQTRQITEDHESKEKEAEEIGLLLERRLVQKDQIESEISTLNNEKEALRTAVEAFRAEREALAAQKLRLSADVSSLETALTIRREELHEMDSKADLLERRVLEGIMNQSRVMLMAKAASPASPKKEKPKGRDLRVPSNASAASQQTVTSSVPSLQANHALALKTKPALRRNGALPNSAERRIMSLSQINHNVPTGAQAYSTATPSLVSSGPQPLKRSHSVKTHFTRKSSLQGRRNFTQPAYNKENETLSEESEDDMEYGQSREGDREDIGTDLGTERRYSNATGTESGMTYGTGSYSDGITPGTDDSRRMSYGTSDLSYGTGSYMTGSELDRRTSLGSTINGTVGARSTIEEETNVERDAPEEPEAAAETEPEQVHESEPLQLEPAPAPMENIARKHFYAPPSDSGLGTELPTAALSGNEDGYFK